MAANIASGATAKVLCLLQGTGGINASLTALQQAALQQGMAGGFAAAVQVTAQNVAPDLVEKSTAVRYPTGEYLLRQSGECADGEIPELLGAGGDDDRDPAFAGRAGRPGKRAGTLHLPTRPPRRSTHFTRGDWGNGMFYSGGYEISFAAVKRGGRGFLQAARIGFNVGVSKS